MKQRCGTQQGRRKPMKPPEPRGERDRTAAMDATVTKAKQDSNGAGRRGRTVGGVFMVVVISISMFVVLHRLAKQNDGFLIESLTQMGWMNNSVFNVWLT
eukprot:TRINITY_DN22056_c0_g1_i1.p1 TRINITY_DN22056_c0_g1~~TRINITY_DN22056_c0_g1_i1.p1  ORF type:complete len:100 (-),score=13.93 TRINITY_DN22056_c0_g1_i1:186-485(-)